MRGDLMKPIYKIILNKKLSDNQKLKIIKHIRTKLNRIMKRLNYRGGISLSALRGRTIRPTPSTPERPKWAEYLDDISNGIRWIQKKMLSEMTDGLSDPILDIAESLFK